MIKLNSEEENLRVGVIDPVGIEDLYKRLNRDLRAHPGERPQIDHELIVTSKISKIRYDRHNPYKYEYGRYIASFGIDYQLFESLCGVFTTRTRNIGCAQLAITFSEAIKYGIIQRTTNPDEIKLCVEERDIITYDTEMLYNIYNEPDQLTGYDYSDDVKMRLFNPDFKVLVEIIPDPVMTKNSMKS